MLYLLLRGRKEEDTNLLRGLYRTTRAGFPAHPWSARRRRRTLSSVRTSTATVLCPVACGLWHHAPLAALASTYYEVRAVYVSTAYEYSVKNEYEYADCIRVQGVSSRVTHAVRDAFLFFIFIFILFFIFYGRWTRAWRK
jgi:hypothetical protein